MKNFFVFLLSLFFINIALGQTDAEKKAAQHERDAIIGKTTEPGHSNETAKPNGAISNRLPHEVPLKPVQPETNSATGVRSNVPGSQAEQNTLLKEAQPVDNTTVQPKRADRVKLERQNNPDNEQKNKKPVE